jgi:antitoxin protein of toxin-antitoxin system
MEGIFDDAEKMAAEHPDQVQNLTEDAEKFADKETGGKYDSEVEKGGEMLDKEIDKQGQQDQQQ